MRPYSKAWEFYIRTVALDLAGMDQNRSYVYEQLLWQHNESAVRRHAKWIARVLRGLEREARKGAKE